MNFQRGRSLMECAYSPFIDVGGGQRHSRVATFVKKGKADSLGAFQIIGGNNNNSDTVETSRNTFPPTTTLPSGKQTDEAFWRAECARLKEEMQRERAESARVTMLYVKAEDARKALEVQLKDMQSMMEDTTSSPASNTPLGAWTRGSSYVLAGGLGEIGTTFDDALSHVESLEFVSPIASGMPTPCVTPKAPTPRVPTPRAASPVQPSPRTRNVYTMSRHECPQSPLLQLSVIELRALAHAVMNPARNANAHSLRPPSSRMSSKKLLTPTALGVSGMSWE